MTLLLESLGLKALGSTPLMTRFIIWAMRADLRP